MAGGAMGRRSHRMTQAMAAGVESRHWEIGDIVKVVEEWEAADVVEASWAGAD